MTLLFIIFGSLCVAFGSCSFEFNDFQAVRSITIDIAALLRGCMVLTKPINMTVAEGRFLERLTYSLAKGQSTRFQRKLISVMSYSPGQYESVFTEDSRRTVGSCFNSVNIVMVNNRTGEQFEQISKSYKFTHSTWVFFANGSLTQEIKNIQLWLNSIVWAVQPKNGDGFSVSEVYRVRQDFPERVKNIGKWTLLQGLQLVSGAKYVPRNDFEGLKLRTASIENWPITSFIAGEAGTSLPIDGFFARLWFELENILNFTSSFKGSVDGTAGIREGGNWTGLVGMIVRDDIDVILSELDYSVSRQQVVDFLLPVMVVSSQVFFPVMGYKFNWNAVFKPFDLSVWYAILGWITIGAIIDYISSHFSAKLGLGNTRETSLVNSFFFILRTLSFQGSSYIPKMLAGRILFVVSYFVASVILPSYSAALISSLTTKTPNKPFDTLEGLIASDYQLIIPPSTSFYDYFLTSTDSVLKTILETRSITGHEFKSLLFSVQYMCNNSKVAYFVIDSLKTHEMWRNGEKLCEIISFGKPLSSVFQTMAFKKHSPYKTVVNYFIIRMAETGIIQRHHHRYIGFKNGPPPKPEIPLNFYDVADIFIFLLVLTLISILILCLERKKVI